MIKKFIPAWMVIMEKFYKLVVFNHIYANGDDHLKNFSVIKIGDTYQLVLGYNLMNTPLHIEGDDLGLMVVCRSIPRKVIFMSGQGILADCFLKGLVS